MQRGYIFKSHGSWFLRYRDVSGKQKAKRLVVIDDLHHSIKAVRPIADSILYEESRKSPSQIASESLTLQQFVRDVYLPHAMQNKRPSTYRGYRNLYNAQLKERVAGMKLAALRPVDIQRLLDTIAFEENLSHQSLMNIKNLLASVLKFALRSDVIRTNPIPSRTLEIPKGKPTGKTYAYSLIEIEKMLEALRTKKMFNAHTAVTVGAWAGLSLAELRGLKWTDIEGEQLTVQRTYWHQVEGPTKTEARSDAVYLLPQVRDTLAEHRKKNPHTVWIFEGPRETPLDLATLGSKHIKPALEGSGVDWHGFHALRRGLATRLQAQGISIEIISRILRHGSVHVTRKHYAKVLDESVKTAMENLHKAQK